MIDIETQLRSYQHATNIRMEIRQMTGRAADEIKKLRAALEFYRDPFAWKKLHDPDDDVRVPDFYSETSFGDRAEAALSATNKL